MSDIINGSASNLMKKAYTSFNALPDEQWICDAIKKNQKCSQKQKVMLGINIGVKEKLRYEHERDQKEIELCSV